MIHLNCRKPFPRSGIGTSNPKQVLDINGQLNNSDLNKTDVRTWEEQLLFIQVYGDAVAISKTDIKLDADNHFERGLSLSFKVIRFEVNRARCF